MAAYGSMVSLAVSQSNCHNWFCLNELGRFFDASFRNMRRFCPSAAPLAAYYFQIVADRNNRVESALSCSSSKLQPSCRPSGRPPVNGRWCLTLTPFLQRVCSDILGPDWLRQSALPAHEVPYRRSRRKPPHQLAGPRGLERTVGNRLNCP